MSDQSDSASPPLIVTTVTLPEPAISLLKEVGTLVGPDDWQSHLSTADALIALLTVRIDRDFLDAAPRLRVIANAAVGYDNVDVAECRARGIEVSNTPGVLTDATADLAMALILSTVRRLPQAERSLRAGEFKGWGFWDYLGGDIGGNVLGIVGMGLIGKAVARRARAFGLTVRYVTRTRLSPEEEQQLEVENVTWEELLETSDIISLHAPATPETRHLLDAAALSRMKPGSYLINTSRGTLVDEEALVRALREGPLSGAGLDVYEHEPAAHPELLKLDNVTLLPHIGSATPNTRTAMASLAARNVWSVLTRGRAITPVGG